MRSPMRVTTPAMSDGSVTPVDDDLLAGHLLELRLQARVVRVAERRGRRRPRRGATPLRSVGQLAQELRDVAAARAVRRRSTSRSSACCASSGSRRSARRARRGSAFFAACGDERVLERVAQLGARLPGAAATVPTSLDERVERARSRRRARAAPARSGARRLRRSRRASRVARAAGSSSRRGRRGSPRRGAPDRPAVTRFLRSSSAARDRGLDRVALQVDAGSASAPARRGTRVLAHALRLLLGLAHDALALGLARLGEGALGRGELVLELLELRLVRPWRAPRPRASSAAPRRSPSRCRRGDPSAPAAIGFLPSGVVEADEDAEVDEHREVGRLFLVAEVGPVDGRGRVVLVFRLCRRPLRRASRPRARGSARGPDAWPFGCLCGRLVAPAWCCGERLRHGGAAKALSTAMTEKPKEDASAHCCTVHPGPEPCARARGRRARWRGRRRPSGAPPSRWRARSRAACAPPPRSAPSTRAPCRGCRSPS